MGALFLAAAAATACGSGGAGDAGSSAKSGERLGISPANIGKTVVTVGGADIGKAIAL